ncbi:hypothetical protein H632_c1218p0 [Helicosporidium sp. ATCC 50920]|nr:hypothetical protein H632_c1218p0 [Helicosporidium sp. ATCC 50920]|eukprot:KDD74568.1 hypothetical protein H632_c1218p0 [Helicosporidium sp. ATCC 50920]
MRIVRLMMERSTTTPAHRLSLPSSVRPARLPEPCQVSTSSPSVLKRQRQSEKRRLRNKSRKSECKTRMKKVFAEVGEWASAPPQAREDLLPLTRLLSEAYAAIDRAAARGVIHWRTAARRKSRMGRARQALLEAAVLHRPLTQEERDAQDLEAFHGAREDFGGADVIDVTAVQEEEEEAGEETGGQEAER